MADEKNTFFANRKTEIAALKQQSEKFNLRQLTAEFNSLYEMMIENEAFWREIADEDKQEFYAYLKVLATFLIKYYENDYVKQDLEELQKKLQKIDNLLGGQPPAAAVPAESSILNSISSSAKLRSNIGALNGFRINLNYRLAMTTAATNYLQAHPFPGMQAIHELMEMPYTPEEFIDGLRQLRPIRNALSVGIYAVRLSLNLLTMMKHVMRATQDDPGKTALGISPGKVFQQELRKRIFTMINDIVWMTVNLLTNYNEYFNISDGAADILSLTFLGFDVVLLAIRWQVSSAEYEADMRKLADLVSEGYTDIERWSIKRRFDKLQDQWEADTAYYKISITAASIVVLGVAAGIAFPGLAVPALVFSAFGNALTNIAEDYKAYCETSIAIKREQNNQNYYVGETEISRNLITDLNAERNQQLYQLVSSASDNLFTGVIYSTAAAISLPLALAFLVGYRMMTPKAVEGQANSPSKQYRLFNRQQEQGHIDPVDRIAPGNEAEPKFIEILATT